MKKNLILLTIFCLPLMSQGKSQTKGANESERPDRLIIPVEYQDSFHTFKLDPHSEAPPLSYSETPHIGEVYMTPERFEQINRESPNKVHFSRASTGEPIPQIVIKEEGGNHTFLLRVRFKN